MLKNSNIETHQLIADILSFDNDNSILKKKLETSKIDWENIVQTASRHLVLTTLYCRLNQKNLLHLLPQDLSDYLKDITSINRNRNKKLIEEAQSLTAMLQKHNIEFVFIKGMALLIGGYFKDIGERMIGDIDILVLEKDAESAFDILKKEGYSKLVEFNYDKSNFRHLPRQINEKKLAAVEIHTHVLNPSHRYLLPIDTIFESRLSSSDYRTPNSYHLNLINILTSQLNDKNYYYNTLNFKNSYDSLVLRILNHIENTDFNKSKFVLHFINLNSVWFRELNLINVSGHNTLRMRSYVLKIKYKEFEKSLKLIKFASFTVINRLNLFFMNKSYRNYLFNSIIFRKS
ncbi:nucleotidyltransferase family protein [Psychroserpens sp. Hel_I_66]|uniref:nucleotidyltransferase family protein n=1 Tax=Psychroserpens sp. Hel_I_66 TaxID=1250004 RepID=UPI000648393D|nr:nucleotidyltransferase family protein [Psychroserpens sp. Hel_I_66]